MATRSTTPDTYGLLQSPVRPVGHHASFTLANSHALRWVWLIQLPFKDLGLSHCLGAAVARSPIVASDGRRRGMAFICLGEPVHLIPFPREEQDDRRHLAPARPRRSLHFYWQPPRQQL